MRLFLKRLFNGIYFFLCFAPIPVFVGYYLLGAIWPAVTGFFLMLPVAYLLSLIPGRIGGKRTIPGAPARTGKNGDPDPDRNLREAALPAPEKPQFPLRGAICLLISLLITLFPLIPGFLGEVWWLLRLATGAIWAIMLPVALKYILSGNERDTAFLLTASFLLYAVAGITLFFVEAGPLNGILFYLGAAFLLATGFSLNSSSLSIGVSSHNGSAAPASIRRRNRVILIVFAALIAGTACFDNLRLWASRAWKASVLAVIRAFVFLTNLLPGSETAAPAGQTGGGDMLAGLPSGEAGAFWQAIEKYAYIAAALVLLVALFFMGRKLGRLMKHLFQKIRAYLSRFTAAIGEEYEDERTSLFDWGELRSAAEVRLKRSLFRLPTREKKWEQMDSREKIRSATRCAYRRSISSVPGLTSMTIQEAAPRLRLRTVTPDALADLYDRARYAPMPPDDAEAETIRKEARP